MTKHITSLLPIYSIAYVNFESEESALAALALNNRDPMSQLRVAYYERGTQPVQFIPDDSNVRGNTNYRILFLTKLSKRVSRLCMIGAILEVLATLADCSLEIFVYLADSRHFVSSFAALTFLISRLRKIARFFIPFFYFDR